jgi:hypothetical protein
MSWVKRNLYFLIGGTVAVVLLVLAGYYFYAQWQLNKETLDKLNSAYDELDQLAKASPNPGNKEVNNIEIASEQEAHVRNIIARERKHFAPVPSIPTTTNNAVTKEEFASAMRRTLDELTHDAEAASVEVPKGYGFTFEAERTLTIFAPGSLDLLAGKLGEIKALCQVLFQAKVNSLDNLMRPRVSSDDVRGPASDFMITGSTTNQLGVLTPFEVVFHCFTPELAGVLAGFAKSPHAFVVQAMNVEPGAVTPRNEGGGAPAAVAPPPKGSLPLLVDEKQLKVTLVLDLVTLLPKK